MNVKDYKLLLINRIPKLLKGFLGLLGKSIIRRIIFSFKRLVNLLKDQKSFLFLKDCKIVSNHTEIRKFLLIALEGLRHKRFSIIEIGTIRRFITFRIHAIIKTSIETHIFSLFFCFHFFCDILVWSRFDIKMIKINNKI